MNRREFLIGTGALVGASLVSNFGAASANWTIGCFNRPWTKWGGIDVALDGIKASGYTLVGLLTRTKEDPFIGVDASPEYLDALKKKMAARGLKANHGAVRTLTKAPVEEGIRDL